MKCLMLIKHDEKDRSLPMPKAFSDAMGEFIADGFKRGVLKDTAGLKATAELHRVHWPAFEAELEVRPLDQP
jgi:hypothetical protein